MNTLLKSLFGLLAYLSVVILPLAIVGYTNGIDRPWQDELSSALAVIAFNILFLEFLLSGRIRALSWIFGIDWVLQIHQLFSRTAMLMLLIHPFIYSLPHRPEYAPGPPDERYLGLTGTTLMSGLIALIVLGALIGLAITRNNSKSSYESWRLTHVILALLVIGLGIHHIFGAGLYSHQDPLKWYWQLAVAIAILSLLRGYLWIPLMQRMKPYRVVSVKPVAHQIHELLIEPVSRSISYRAGQFTWLKLGSTKPLFENPFSFASYGLEQSRIRFIIKDIGDFTHAVGELHPGQTVYLNGAFGNFGKNIHGDEPLVLIAGGVGIAPIKSVLESFAGKNIGRPIYLIYGNRIADQALDLAKDPFLAHCKDLRVFQILTEPHSGWSGLTGVIDRDNLARCLPENILKNTNVSYLVCGPAVMIDATETALADLGVSLSQIESERFQYDFTSKTKRNFLSVTSWLIGTILLATMAIYFAYAW